MSSFLISEPLAVWEHSAMAQHVKPCQVLQFPSCFDRRVGDITQRWIKIKRLVFRPLPKMINPCRKHYWVLSGCAFSLPVIVLFLLLPSSDSLLIIWKEGKNVWIEEGDFPTVTQHRKIRHCGQVPIPVPCCTGCCGLRDNVLIIERPFLLSESKWWRIQLDEAAEPHSPGCR